jgi:GNAT superfamily N-acetyltransferase
MKIEVIRALLGDAEDIRRVYADAYRENRELGFPATAETVSAQEIGDWISNDRMWVAKIAEEVVGAVRVRDADPDFPLLGRLGVASKYKGFGIGKLLMDTAEHDVQQRGRKGITLTVAEAHPFLSKIYAKRGYQMVGPRTPQHTLYNEIVMRKTFKG